MSSSINNELKIMENYLLKTTEFVDKNGIKQEIVDLTIENVAKVEAMIRNDSAYNKSVQEEAHPVYDKNGKEKYGGSSAFWMTQLRKALNSEGDLFCSYEGIISGAVASVDRENSTHLNADGCGRKEITDRICALSRDELKMCLMDPEYEDMKLIRIISARTKAEKGRVNISFASKFCHYACFYVFEKTEFQDNYSIYDTILRTVLPKYIKFYDIKGGYKLDDYGQYRRVVDLIRESCGVEISRNGFDHLLWYYHKGRM